jgi:hypothetical protein
MTKPTEKQIQEAAKILSQAGASKGGRKRWEGRTDEEKRKHALMMVKARGKNKPKKSVDN